MMDDRQAEGNGEVADRPLIGHSCSNKMQIGLGVEITFAL